MLKSFFAQVHHFPYPENLKLWNYNDYIIHFLSFNAMHARLCGNPSPVLLLKEEQLFDFCIPIRERIEQQFNSINPRISIILPAYNEEVELLPTLISYTMLDIEPGLAELIIADNRSSDLTASIIKHCGAKYVFCPEKGVGHARRAAYQAIAPTSEYIWLTDADARVVPPLRRPGDEERKSTIIKTNYQYLEGHPNVIGISTGGVIEGAHWLYHFVHNMMVTLGRTKRISCWAGCNQFVRRWALDEIGGIDVDVEFGDDQHRQYELARLGKRLKKNMESANSNPALADPVFYSGRRYATLRLLIRHYIEAMRRPPLPKDQYGFPIHKKGEKWRLIR